MSKLYLWNTIFVIIEVISWILLTIQIFGDMNPDAIIISANILGIGLIGTCICSIIRAINKLKENNHSHKE